MEQPGLSPSYNNKNKDRIRIGTCVSPVKRKAVFAFHRRNAKSGCLRFTRETLKQGFEAHELKADPPPTCR